MTVLNFPDDPASVNNVFVAPNGVTYIFDGVKWVGETSVTSTNLGAVTENIIPYTDNTYDLGSPTKKWSHVYTSGGSIYLDDIKLSNNNGTLVVQQVTDAGLETESPVPDTPGVVTTDRIVNGSHSFTITAAGGLELDGSPFTGGGGGSSNQLLNGLYDVTLDVNGNTVFPGQSTYIRQNNSYTRTVNGDNISGVPTIIWIGTGTNITSVKMTIQIEGSETGDSSGWHTQVCEAIIADRWYGNAGAIDPQMTVYGVVHTSVAPLATFTVQRNPTTHFIEVVATPTGTANGTLYPKVHSVELGTRD